VRAQNEMARQHELGQISYQIAATSLPGAYGVMASTMNDVVASHIAVNGRVVAVVESYAHGDFSVVMDRLPGEMAQISAAMDEVKASFSAIHQEIFKLVDAAVKGDFAARGPAERYQHDFRRMVEGLNQLMEVSQTGLNEVVRVLSAIAEGNLTAKITRQYQGTFGQLKDDTNRTAQQLAAIVGQIREGTENLNMSAREIAAGNLDLSSRTEQQAASLQETASAMEQLTATVRQNAENAKEANQLAIGASDVARKGGGVVHEVVSTMSSISESSKRIVEIISVIDGIAFQTNILALNAAVEAARAGDQGRGFAVVATEVRSLAQRSAAAAREIKSLIGDSVAKVESGSKLVDSAGTTMEEIVHSVKRVTDIIAQIATASSEQSAGIEQVNLAITQMDQVTHQNATLVEEAAAAAASMEHQAQSLEQAVAVFRIEGQAQALGPHGASTRSGSVGPKSSPQVASPPPRKPVAKPAGKSVTQVAAQLASVPTRERRGPTRAQNVARLPVGSGRAPARSIAEPTGLASASDANDDWAEF
jgi:methyl-accepting chemotaxis protein